jgi:NTE family protein
MSNTPSDKSAPTAYCTPEGVRSRAVSGDHTDLSVPSAGLGSSRSSVTSTTKDILRVSRIPPRRIALCGGGILGIAHAGFLKAMEEAGMLGHVREYIGISAGALTALFLVLGYTVKQVEEIATNFQFNSLRNISPENILNFPFTFGLDRGELLESFIISILHQKGFPPDTTFEELHAKCPIHFRCFATELQTCRLRQFSTTSTPKVSICFALRASMSLPFVYTPVQEAGGALLIDGGVLNNLPLVFMTPAEVAETVCIFFTHGHCKLEPVTSWRNMLQMVFDSMVVMKSSPFIKKFQDRVICVPVDLQKSLDFDMPVESKKTLIQYTYEITRKFLFTPSHKPARRFSAS